MGGPAEPESGTAPPRAGTSRPAGVLRGLAYLTVLSTLRAAASLSFSSALPSTVPGTEWLWVIGG